MVAIYRRQSIEQRENPAPVHNNLNNILGALANRAVADFFHETIIENQQRVIHAQERVIYWYRTENTLLKIFTLTLSTALITTGYLYWNARH